MIARKTYKIGDLCEQIRGVTYTKTDAVPILKPGYKPVLRANNITDHGLKYRDLVYVPAGKISSRQHVRKNDVVVAASSGSLDVVGKAARALADFDGGFGAFCKVLRPNEKVDAGYFAHFFQTRSYRWKVSSLAAGANINNLRNEHLDDLEIHLPPLPEQRRISAILDKTDSLRTKRREAIAKLEQLLQSVFLDMFGDPVTNPKGWPVVQFGSVTESRLGKMLDEKTRVGQYMRPYLANVNVQWGRFALDSLRQMNFKPEDQQEFSLRFGDVLMCEGGEPGRCAIWKDQLQDCYYQKALHRIRCNPKHCVPEYVQWLFWFLGQAGAFRSSIAVATIAHLPGIKLKKLEVPMPSLLLQTKFAQHVEKVGEQKDTLQRSAGQLDTLFASLQHRAFSGTL